MYRSLIFLLLLCALTGLLGCHNNKPDIGAPIFSAHNVNPKTATFIIKRLSDNKIWMSNPARADVRFIPASTSKIPHTLIAFETQRAETDTLFEWDGQERWSKSWNQNLTFAQAYKRSAAWVYQDITRSLGPDVMRLWLKRFNYGNYDVGPDDNVELYWLTGPLEVSATEQVDFLTALSQGNLPLSDDTYRKSRIMFENKSVKDHVLYAKTGWFHDETRMDIGWFVGWVETQGKSETYVFALNMDMPNRGDHLKRKPVIMDALIAVGAWPKSPP